MTKLLFFDSIYARKKRGVFFMKLKDLEFNINRAIINYYSYLYNVNISLNNNLDEKINIKFTSKDFISIMKLGEYFKYSNGGNCNSMETILDRIYRRDLRNLTEEEKVNLSTISSILSNIKNIDISTVHSIIDHNNDKYIIMYRKNSNISEYVFALKLSKVGANDYNVKEIITMSAIDELINKPNTYISVPKSSSYQKEGPIPSSVFDRLQRIAAMYVCLEDRDGSIKYVDDSEVTTKLGDIADAIHLNADGEPRTAKTPLTCKYLLEFTNKSKK